MHFRTLRKYNFKLTRLSPAAYCFSSASGQVQRRISFYFVHLLIFDINEIKSLRTTIVRMHCRTLRNYNFKPTRLSPAAYCFLCASGQVQRRITFGALAAYFYSSGSGQVQRRIASYFVHLLIFDLNEKKSLRTTIVRMHCRTLRKYNFKLMRLNSATYCIRGASGQVRRRIASYFVHLLIFDLNEKKSLRTTIARMQCRTLRKYNFKLTRLIPAAYFFRAASGVLHFER
jgi:muconolactone delta-isomerase